MYLSEISNLPQKALKNLEGEVAHIKIYLVQDFSLSLLKRMVNFGLNIFGETGMDEWGLVPQIRHGNVFLLKQDDKKIIGIAILMRDWEDIAKAYLIDYAIAEQFQGQGLGYHFLVEICKNLKEQGFERVGLTVDPENIGAVKLYKDKLGFKVAEMRENEYGKGHNRLIMRLDLTAD
ncbi:MAG: GNAT family N-acetyltransferase [Peptococcaceae bacterium]|nr:GNAT family N-acetyltransferase [Peptococcaceae bacterium]